MAPGKLMREIKKGHWFEKSEEGRFTYMYYFSQLYCSNLKPVFPSSFGYVLMHEKMGVGNWGFSIDGLSKFSSFVIKKAMKSKGYLNKLLNDWSKKSNKFNKELEKMDAIDLRFVSDEELVGILKRLNKAYIEQLTDFIFTDAVEFKQHDILKEKLGKYNISQEELDLLLLPNDLTYQQNEELELLKLAKKIKDDRKDKKLGIYRSFGDAWNSSDNLEKYLTILKKHQKKYFWYAGTFGNVLEQDNDHFFLRLKDIINNKDINHEIKRIITIPNERAKKQRTIIKTYKLDKEAKRLFEVFSTVAMFANLRRENSLKANCYIKNLSKEIGKRVRIRYELLEYCTDEELEEVIKTPVLEKKLKKRIKEVFGVFKEGKKPEIFVGATAKHLQAALEYSVSKDHKEIKGVIICKGFSQGSVKKVYHPKDLAKIKEGDIVVAKTAQVELEPVIDKVSAIVTDEGNYTDNVALLARDKNKPCIVGTHVATKLLRDNDTIIVDADKGTIRKIKKH
jgi:phosphohistidine swiveling domain-containing protein